MSLIARHLEAAGIPTVCMASALDIIEAGNPPRAAFSDYPLGHTCGKAFDPDDQLSVVRAALTLLDTATTPGVVVDLERHWDQPGWRESAMNPSGGDTREQRDTTPQYQFEADRAAAEG
ncbi:MAG: hypothetical protein AAF458_10395 [Pseudomonadota bacterium]